MSADWTIVSLVQLAVIVLLIVGIRRGWFDAVSDEGRAVAYHAAYAAIQEEFDERGLGDASLIARVAVDEAFEAVGNGTLGYAQGTPER